MQERTGPGAPAGGGPLRAARSARGWSQTDAAGRLATIGRAAGVPTASAASLKTLLSRWENGHALPDPQYRDLLAELYERSPGELGIAVPADRQDTATARTRLRAALAAAAAAGRGGLDLWWEQLSVAMRLDDELGTAGAGELVRAQVDQLDETLTHTPAAARREAVAAVLAWAAALAGAQELDGGHPDLAWRRYERARTAAAEARLPTAAAVALAGQAAVLVEVDEPAAASALVATTPVGPPMARARIDAARGLVEASVGHAAAARSAIAAAASTVSGGVPGSGAHRAAADVREAATDRTGPAGRPLVEPADLHRWHGHVLLTLGDAGAVEPLRRALAAAPRSARHRAAVHADLARALATAEPDTAAEHAREARALAERIGSERIRARIAEAPNGPLG